MKKTLFPAILMITLGCAHPGFASGSDTAHPASAAAIPAHEEACQACSHGDPASALNGAPCSGTVAETMNSGGYTYVCVDTGSEKVWAAAPQCSVATGAQVALPSGAPMPGFHSKTLNRTFDQITFVPQILTGSDAAAIPTQVPASGSCPMDKGTPGMPAASMIGGHGGMTGKPAPDVDLSGITKVEDGKTIAEIFEEKASLIGKEVKVRGKVVKFNAAIMGKNWIHIKDGTGTSGTSDLTVTTQDTAKVGDTVVVTGKVVLDKEFGHGFTYPVIIEDGAVKVE